MAIAVIGGSGFIGTVLVRRLLAHGETVRIIDIRPNMHYPHQSHLADATDPDTLRTALGDANIVYHLAAEHRDDVRPARRYYEVNVGSAQVLSDIARDPNSPIDTIIFSSTVAVYGKNLNNGGAPVTEQTPCQPHNDYGNSKYEAEKIFRAWESERPSRRLVIIRPTVVFGRGNRGNLYNLWKQITGGKFIMVGAGNNRKSMAYVENVAALLVHCLQLSKGSHTINYADTPDYTMTELCTLIAEKNGTRLPSFHVPYFLGLIGGALLSAISSITRRSVPITLSRVIKFCTNSRIASRHLTEIGYTPEVTLHDALLDTITHRFEADPPLSRTLRSRQ